MSRSLYNLQPTKKTYRDMYTGTEGQIITDIPQFPRLYWFDTLRSVGQFLQL
jgi:hypothetical protein